MPRSVNRRILFWVGAETLEKFLSKHPLEQRHGIARRAFEDFLDGRHADHAIEAKRLDGETKRLKNLKLCLDIWNGLKVAGFSLDQAAEVMRGDKTIPAPELPFMKPSKSGGGACEFCGHEHVATEPRVCRTVSCLCGVR